jgi:hypothetical protein
MMTDDGVAGDGYAGEPLFCDLSPEGKLNRIHEMLDAVMNAVHMIGEDLVGG